MGPAEQKKIIIKASPGSVTINQGVEGNDFYIAFIIINRTKDTIEIPPSESNLHEVFMEFSHHPRFQDLDDLRICGPAIYENQFIAPRDTGKIQLNVFGSCFNEKGVIEVIFYVPVKYNKLNTKKEMAANKVYVTVL